MSAAAKPEPHRLAARCPECSTPPALRLYPALVKLAQLLPPDEPIATVQCQECMRERRRRVIYDVPAKAIAAQTPTGGG